MGGMRWDGIHTLVERSRSGDRDAWTGLHAAARDYLHGLARSLLGPGWPERTAHDLTQDTWLKFAESIGEFRGGADDEQTGAVLRAWLANTMTRLAKNYVRRNGAAKRTPPAGVVRRGDGSSAGQPEPPAPDPSPSHPVRQAEERARVAAALTRLEEPLDRDVVTRVFFQSKSLRQTAGELGLTYDQVRYRFDKALARLGDLLRDRP